MSKASTLYSATMGATRVFALMALLGFAGAVSANVIIVTTEADGNPNVDGQCSLREAITNAILDTFQGSPDCVNGSGSDEIIFAQVYFSTPRTISLTSQLPFLSNITVTGPGRSNLTIDGGGVHRIFVASDGNNTVDSTVAISDMTLINGNGNGSGSGGGAINSVESLTVSRVRFENNDAGVGNGGAIRSQDGTLTINASGFFGNRALNANNGFGGAIYVDPATTQLQISSSLFDGNTSIKAGGALHSSSPSLNLATVQFLQNQSVTGFGGAMAAYGASATIDYSWFDGNEAANAGGAILFNGTSLTTTRSTFSGNVANLGAAIHLLGGSTATLRQDTFSGNQSLNGAGAVTLNGSASATVSFSTFHANLATAGGTAVHNFGTGAVTGLSSVLASGSNAQLCGGGNISFDASTQTQHASCSGATLRGAGLFNSLTSLQKNGGAWPTHAPVSGSVAIDAAPSCNGLTFDQRGYPRPQDGDGNGSALCDAGSVEYQSIVVTTTLDNVNADGLCSLREAFNNAALNSQFYADCAPGRGNDTIEFSLATPAIINLGSALPTVDQALSIIGPGRASLTINAGAFLATPMRFIDNNNLVDLPVLIQGLTLANGNNATAGFILSTEDLTIEKVDFVNNASSGNNAGGAVTQNGGNLSVLQSTFSGGSSTGTPSAGAIFVQGSDAVAITTSTFDQNQTTAGGGALALFGAGPISLTHSTFSGNANAGNGGAIYLQGDTDITARNLTFTANTAVQGGGIYAFGVNASVDLHNGTFFRNTANAGLSVRSSNNAAVSIADSLFHDGGIGGGHCSAGGGGTITLTGTNLSDDASCAGATTSTSAALRIDTNLLDNGGPTPTFALLRGSPAIDAATDCGGVPIDQRGIARGGDGDLDGAGGCDVGAYELQPIVVDTIADVSDDLDGVCSLREAITNANQDRRVYRSCARGLGSDLIMFDLPNPSVITLGGALPFITTPMTIDGPGKARLTIDANQLSRHFLVEDGNPANQIRVVITEMTLINGVSGNGGSIRSFESLTLDLIDFLDNSANFAGGGALAIEGGSLGGTRLNFSGNVADSGAGGGSGGAIMVRAGASISINQAEFSGNSAAAWGGALELRDAAPSGLTRVGFTGNAAGNPGGAIAVLGSSLLDVANMTLSGNQSSLFGGGLFVSGGTANVRHATFHENTAATAGSSLRLALGATVVMSDSLFVGSGASSTNCSVSDSSLTMAAANLVDDASCNGVPATDAAGIRLDDAPGFNGGLSRTVALLPGSLAIDAGLDCAAIPSDQRGYGRPQDGDLDGVAVCDIGAFELRPIIVDTVADVTDSSDGFCSLREAIVNANGDSRQFASCVAGGGPDLIAFDLPPLSTIVLTGVLPSLTGPVMIKGPGRDTLSIDANASGRHFIVNNGNPELANVEISGLTLTNASAPGPGGSLFSSERLVLRGMRFSGNAATGSPGGAASVSAGSAEIIDTEFSGNTANNAVGGRGGALRVALGSTAVISNSQFLTNSTATYGGAVVIEDGGSLTGSDLLFSGNQASLDGGALDLYGATAQGELAATRFTGNSSVAFGGAVSVRDGADLSLHRVTLDANQSGRGGGASVRLNSSLDADNLTISGNTADLEGGGFYAGAPLTLVALTGATFFGNNAANASKAIRASQASVSLVNSLLEDNGIDGDLCNGAGISANSGTVADDASCNGGVVDASLNVGPLADFGFIAPSHGLMEWSAATDVAADCAGLSFDQRGQPRPSGDGRCDAGSFEVQNAAPIALDDSYQSGETQNVIGPNVLSSSSGLDSDPDATGALEVIRVNYVDGAGITQTKEILGVHFNEFVLPPGILVNIRRDGGLAYSPGISLQNLAVGDSFVQTFSYVLGDGFSRDEATVTLTFIGEDTPPVLADDARTVGRDSSATSIDVLANDADVDGGSNTITAVTQPGNGVVTIASDGLSLAYQPNAAYCNDGVPSDDFTYTFNGSLTANVAMTVTCGPVGIDLSIGISGDTQVEAGTPLAYQVLVQNIGDVDGTADISVLFDARLQDVTWSCTVVPAGNCSPGSGDIATQVDLPMGAQVQYDITANPPGQATNTPLTVSAAVMPVGDTDVDMNNNVDSFETETALFFDGFESIVP